MKADKRFTIGSLKEVAILPFFSVFPKLKQLEKKVNLYDIDKIWKKNTKLEIIKSSNNKRNLSIIID